MTPELRHDALVAARARVREAIAVDPLMEPVVDEVFRDPEAGIPLHVVDEILAPAATVKDLDHQIEPSALVDDDPRHARIVVGLAHADDGEHIG